MKLVGGVERHFGWTCIPTGFHAYAATLDRGEDFWDLLRAADDGGDRYYYRALALSLRDGNHSRWLRDRDGVPCIVSYDQGQIGSCVGNAEAKREGHIAALDRWLRLEAEAFTGMFAPEWAYYSSRVESGIHSGDGSTGFGAAKAAVGWGALVQGTYGGVDVSRYDVSRCRSWGNGKGVPTEAKTEAANHKCTKYIQVNTAEKAWLAAGAGLVINQCSDVGWDSGDRDKDGALKVRGSWSHSMCLGAARRTTSTGRKLVLIENSWGDNWTGGPYWLDQPWGSFYADLDDVGDACLQGDTFIDVGYVGDVLPPVPVDFTRA